MSGNDATLALLRSFTLDSYPEVFMYTHLSGRHPSCRWEIRTPNIGRRVPRWVVRSPDVDGCASLRRVRWTRLPGAGNGILPFEAPDRLVLMLGVSLLIVKAGMVRPPVASGRILS